MANEEKDQLLHYDPYDAKRRYANGRRAALQAMDALMSEPGNLQKLYDAAQKEFDDNPVKFFQEVIVPITPRELQLEDDGDNSPQAKAAQAREAIGEADALMGIPSEESE